MTPLEIGSDIGGSIRVPAAYCGVYGHRPSETAIPRAGSFPFADLVNPGAIMGVQGPLAPARSTSSCCSTWSPGRSRARMRGGGSNCRHHEANASPTSGLPSCRRCRSQPSLDMQARLDELASYLGRAGATVGEAMPELDHDQYFRDYLTLFTVITSQGQSREERESSAILANRDEPVLAAQAAGLTLDAAAYLALLNRREAARVAWRSFFAEWDVLVCPAALDAAFVHQTNPHDERTLAIDDRQVPYILNIVHPMGAIFAGQPSTAFPAGLNKAGLPLGLQALGPYLEDRTTLRFAQLLEREWRGFEPPPGF